ncbi:MAG TPA: hypothetical protein DIS66_05200 [Candidatus Omnitrophica bacterium]|mgnify:FL=1|nr:hypothetical protein [Candidatus Omnitrophota bacterium]
MSKHFHWFLIFMVVFGAVPIALGAEENTPKKAKKLEEMSAEEFRAVLKQSHAESASRLGGSGALSETDDSSKKSSSLSEKRAYETSAQSRIDLLSHKIRSLDNHYHDNWGYAQKDAAKLREIQYKARDYLMKIRLDNSESWKVHKNALESLLRQTSDY